MNWKPGDRALFIADCPAWDHAGLSGSIVQLRKFIGNYVKKGKGRIVLNAWRTESGEAVAERCLHPIDDDHADWQQIEKLFKKKPNRVINRKSVDA